MKWFVNSKISVLLIGLCAVLLVGAGSAEADFTFGTPTNLGPVVNSYANEHPAGMTADGLSLYFSSRRPGGTYSEWYDIWVTTRPTKDDPWEEPVNLGSPINTSQSYWEPDITPDGLTLVFNRVGTVYPNWDVWIATRPTTNDSWSNPVNLGPTVNSYVEDMDPCISADGLTLYFNSRRSGGHGDMDILMTTRPTINDPWSEPVNLGPPVNTSSSDACPDISTDGRMMFFSSRRPGGFGGGDLYMTSRPTTDDPWGEPVNLGPAINTSGHETYPDISPDGRLLTFASNWPGGMGGNDLWPAPIVPVVDLNGDGIVDSGDMCIMVDYWGTDEPLCDIGPTPLGDGIVDAQDLIVLAEHLFEEMDDSTLIAHWPLDEAQGNTVYDYAGTYDGRILGGPVWQPSGGIVDGAIQLDGVDDFIFINSIPDSIKGPFSVFTWVKGGAPGQVVISQTDEVNWLCAETLEGNLMTELKASDRAETELLSQTIITDGNWHRLGLVWDGSHRKLYVDEVAVAEDTQDNLEVSEKRLYIGTGKAMKSGTYWSGLIDDVRIYNVALAPEEIEVLAQ